MLAKAEIQFRVCWLIGVAAGLSLVGFFDPVRMSSWIPVHTSCGAVTGLPCVFCGMTRGVHYLLNGDLSRALYFNWLSVPFVAGSAIVSLFFAIELLVRRRIVQFPELHLTRRSLSTAAVLLVSLWALNAYLAVSQHKRELLNPAGPLYALFVR